MNPQNDSEEKGPIEQIEEAKAEVRRLAEGLGGSTWTDADGTLQVYVPDPPPSE